jgi:pimeloyl-ACP methyl ester carboxylesterase
MNNAAYDMRLRISGDGPEAVILVPGMDGTGELFYAQVPKLARRYRVATYALRDDAPSMDVLVDDLRTVVETVAPHDHRAIVIGESFGGAVTLSFAASRPHWLTAAVVLNSFPWFRPQVRLRLAIGALEFIPWGAMTLVRRATAHRMHSPHTQPADLAEFLRRTAAIRREGYINRLRILRTYDARDRLAVIPVPMLFLAADCDRLVPAVEQARLMASRVPGAALRILEGHGHICLIAPDVDLERILGEWRGESRWPDASVPRVGVE